ncbi:interferon-induced protein with tetratricopeptide repeats 1B-like [Puntigrus tetrazona]|uniref:interferon-induced protein with tetratricopeptide repeats 1B-like n=1 Tax=Puntigrus tetrazona TaxID=1606681 RepID=UPI001C89B4E2|nr:interferon-induced protein with tetratricopeptide repeats 1B-like [Puntigrus tetrazona]
MDLEQHLQKLECHFNWDLGCNKNELKTLLRNLEDVNQERCTWLLHYYNLLGYIQHALGSDTEALMNLHKAGRVMQERRSEEAGVLLQVNKGNLAWVYFLMGEMDESKRYLEEVEKLQQMYPAPTGCALHPEVSGEKGWTLMKFNKSMKRKAIDYFKMALKAEPERKEWHSGLAIAMGKTCSMYNCSPKLKAEILKQLKIAHENNPNNLFIHAFYLEIQSEVQQKDNERQMEDLLEQSLETGDLECLGTILAYFRNISADKAIEAAERVHETFSNSKKVLKHRANCYKWKVYKMKEDDMERRTLARDSVELFKEVIRYYPDSLREKIALASMYEYTGNSEKANDIYEHLLKMKDDLPPHSQQYIYYSYACHLHSCRRSEESINFHMKVAEIPGNSVDKEKSIKILKKYGKNGRNPRCEEIWNFLERINIDD